MALNYYLEFKGIFQYIAIQLLLWEIEILIIFNTKYHQKKTTHRFSDTTENIMQPLQCN